MTIIHNNIKPLHINISSIGNSIADDQKIAFIDEKTSSPFFVYNSVISCLLRNKGKNTNSQIKWHNAIKIKILQNIFFYYLIIKVHFVQ